MERLAIAAATLALAACGQAPEDEAHEDGERLGQAIAHLYAAETPEDAREAVDEVVTARNEVRQDAAERVSDHADVQRDSLREAVEAYQEAQTATEASDVESARTDLRSAIQDVMAQASSARTEGDSIEREFWRGVTEGFKGD